MYSEIACFALCHAPVTGLLSFSLFLPGTAKFAKKKKEKEGTSTTEGSQKGTCRPSLSRMLHTGSPDHLFDGCCALRGDPLSAPPLGGSLAPQLAPGGPCLPGSLRTCALPSWARRRRRVRQCFFGNLITQPFLRTILRRIATAGPAAKLPPLSRHAMPPPIGSGGRACSA